MFLVLDGMMGSDKSIWVSIARLRALLGRLYILSGAGFGNLGFQPVAKWTAMRDDDAGHKVWSVSPRSLFPREPKPLNGHVQNPFSHSSSCIFRQSLQIPGPHICPFPLSLRLPVSASSLPFPSLQRLTFSPAQKELPRDKFLPSWGSIRLVRQGRRECKPSAVTFIHVPSRQVKYQFLYMVF